VKGNTDNSGPQTRSLSEAEREALFKRLHLAHMRRIYQDVAVQAEKEGWSYADFLTLLLAEEVAGRKQTRLQRLTRSAHFIAHSGLRGAIGRFLDRERREVEAWIALGNDKSQFRQPPPPPSDVEQA